MDLHHIKPMAVPLGMLLVKLGVNKHEMIDR